MDFARFLPIRHTQVLSIPDGPPLWSAQQRLSQQLGFERPSNADRAGGVFEGSWLFQDPPVANLEKVDPEALIASEPSRPPSSSVPYVTRLDRHRFDVIKPATIIVSSSEVDARVCIVPLSEVQRAGSATTGASPPLLGRSYLTEPA